MTEEEGRRFDVITGNKPLAPPPPNDPAPRKAFPARALRDKPGEAPLIERDSA